MYSPGGIGVGEVWGGTGEVWGVLPKAILGKLTFWSTQLSGYKSKIHKPNSVQGQKKLINEGDDLLATYLKNIPPPPFLHLQVDILTRMKHKVPIFHQPPTPPSYLGSLLEGKVALLTDSKHS